MPIQECQLIVVYLLALISIQKYPGYFYRNYCQTVPNCVIEFVMYIGMSRICLLDLVDWSAISWMGRMSVYFWPLNSELGLTLFNSELYIDPLEVHLRLRLSF